MVAGRFGRPGASVTSRATKERAHVPERAITRCRQLEAITVLGMELRRPSVF